MKIATTDLRIPTDETLKTFKDTDEECNLVRNENADEMFEKLFPPRPLAGEGPRSGGEGV